MKFSWKTTLFGLLAFIPQIINPMITIVPTPWDKALMGICAILAFYFAKDKDKTGVTS